MSSRCEELLRRAQAAFEGGGLEAASRLALSAHGLARDDGDEVLADRAFCHHCAYEIQLGGGDERIPQLKRILLQSTDPVNRYLAAYHTAVAYDLAEQPAKARSYAVRATTLAIELDDPARLATVENLAGNLAIQASDFADAEVHFKCALASYPASDGFRRIMRAQITDNLGYVLMCTERLAEGLALCEQARAELEGLGADHYLHTVLQDLCYGYLLDERLERAERCGERALELAIEHSDEMIAKNCLFLLSEAAVRRGDAFRARRYLRELVSHYPEVGVSDEIIDVFLATDLTTLVNLRG